MSLNDSSKKELLKSIGENIRKVRKSKNMTQADLAFKLNVDPGKIGRTERGEYDFKISSLAVIAQGLDIDLHLLLEGI
ncbi:MAG: helix-turn-helix domain-containing protein [Bacteroidales bacterium]|nr:helix-turn-helix domain-containing protein [Bacteroidales bacterium]